MSFHRDFSSFLLNMDFPWDFGNLYVYLYIKNARECLTMISKHERAYEARGAKPRELCIVFECFDIMVQHESKFLMWLLILIDYSSVQEPTYINAQRIGNCKLIKVGCISSHHAHLRMRSIHFPYEIFLIWTSFCLTFSYYFDETLNPIANSSCMPCSGAKLYITMKHVVSLHGGCVVLWSVLSSGSSLEIRITSALITPGIACISPDSQ